MALLTSTELNISINDEGIGFVEKEPGYAEVNSYGEVRLPKGVIKNGYIKEPEILLEKMKNIFKSYTIKSKNIRWIINEQNAILREITIQKEELQNQNLETYLKGQVGKTLHFPFKKPIFEHFVKEETDDYIKLVMYILDENMLQDYMDVFDRLKIKNVTYEMPALALWKLYYQDDEANLEEDNKRKRSTEVNPDNLIDGLMVFQLFDTMFSITIFEKEYPVFSLMEDIENEDQRFEIAEQYIFRISNYYKFNKNDGQKAIRDVVIFNLTSVASNEQVQTDMEYRLKGMRAEVFDLSTKSDYYQKILPTGCYVALAASLYK